MPRNITINFADGARQTYRNVPDNVTEDQVRNRARRDYGGTISSISGLPSTRERQLSEVVSYMGNIAGNAANVVARSRVARPRRVNPIPRNAPTSTEAWMGTFRGLSGQQARQAYQENRQRVANGRYPNAAARNRALAAFDADPRIAAIRQIGGYERVTTRRAELQDVARQAGQNRAQLIRQTAENAVDQADANSPVGDFGNAYSASALRNMFGVPERLGAALQYYSGNSGNLDYGETLDAIRAGTDRRAARSTGGNIAGALVGGGISGGAAGRVLGAGAGLAARYGSPVISRAGNVLSRLATLERSAPGAARLSTAARVARGARNAGRMALAGGAQGGLQAAGEGSDLTTGVATGAIAAPILGMSVSGLGAGARAANRVLRTHTRAISSSERNALREIVQENPAELAARRNSLSARTGGRIPLAAALNPTDFSRVSTDIVQRSPETETIARGHSGRYIRSFMNRMLNHINEAARMANAGNADATVAAGDLADMRRSIADQMMAPIEDIKINLRELPVQDLERTLTARMGQRITGLRDRVSEAFSSPDGGFPREMREAGATPEEVSQAMDLLENWNMLRPGDTGEVNVTVRELDSLRRTLDAAYRSTRNSNPADAYAFRNAARIVADFTGERVPAYREMVNTYAANSRIIDGFENAVGGNRPNELTDDLLRDAVRTPEGRVGARMGEVHRLRLQALDRPSSAISLARNLSSDGNLTRPRTLDPTARPGTVTENLGDLPARNLAGRASAETDVLNRMFDIEKINAAAANEQGGTIDPYSLSRLAIYRRQAPTSQAYTIGRVVQSLIGRAPLQLRQDVAESLAHKLFSTDRRDIAEALQMLESRGIPQNRVGRILYEAITGAPHAVQDITHMSGGRYANPVIGAGGANIVGGRTLPIESTPTTPTPQIAPENAEQDETADNQEFESPYDAKLQELYDNEDPDFLDLVERVERQESGGQHFRGDAPIESSAGAIGAMQVMPETAPEAARLAGLPWDENAYYNDPSYNRLIGIAYLAEMLRRFDGDVNLALAAYNAGPGAAESYARGERGLPDETDKYIRSIEG